MFTGLAERTFKVLSDPENMRQGKPTPADPESTVTGVEEGKTYPLGDPGDCGGFGGGGDRYAYRI
jgi:hypothetical protein